jgi:hypothetical protein
MQLSTDKLQSTRHSESLRRSSLIRSTFLQSRKHFCDLIHSLIKISSTSNTLVPVIIQNEDRTKLLPYQRTITSQKRKSCHVDAVKRIRLTSSSTSSSNVSNEITSD